MKKLLFPLSIAISMYAAGCESQSDDMVLGDDAFVAVPRDVASSAVGTARRALSAAGAPTDVGDGSGAFYIAVNKKELGQKWFMSSFLKQYFPGAVSYGAARSMGTRVVSFKEQNGRLFVFDADDRRASSDTFSPELIVDAYPIIQDHPTFNRMAGAERFILVDPAAGLNRFALIGDAFAGGSSPDRFNVDLAFLQRFRKISDGVTWEQVFVGYGVVADPAAPGKLEDNQFKGSGTLGLAWRRYGEGEGYTPTPLPVKEHYFRGQPRQIKNEGTLKQVAAKWNIRPGMKPIKWVISPEFKKLAEDPNWQGYDIIGAVKAGIENWNLVFGFKALEAVVGDGSESFADDDTNYLVFDADPTYGAAFANWRLNPNTGEIRGASVYFNALWFEVADIIFKDDPSQKTAPLPQMERPRGTSIAWLGMQQEPLCLYWAPPLRQLLDDEAQPGGGAGDDEKYTKKTKVERYITHVIVHEIGHTLGLRHNFKGSFSTPGTSVMEYTIDDEAFHSDKPGSYDAAAIKYLYGLSKDAPADPFCTDESTRVDVDCTRFDRSSDPLTQFYGPRYRTVVLDYIEGRSTAAPNATLNNVLKYVRSGSQAQKVQAWSITTESLRVPVSKDKLASSQLYGPLVDATARRVFQRLYLDATSLRGDFFADPTFDPALHPLIVAELRGNLLNLDGIRTFATRRVCVDVLKKLQTTDAYQALVEAREYYAGIRSTLSGATLALTDDLIARIDQATRPYFIN